MFGGRLPAMRTVAIVLGVALAACDASPRPDLRRLYEFGAPAIGQPPVVVIPGILGSRLRDPATGEELWPGSLWGVAFGAKQHLALPFDPATLQPAAEARPDGLFEAALGTDFYGEILRTLEHAGRYVRAVPGTPVDPEQRHYYVFAYDWRQDNVRTAARLDAFIEQIRRDHGDPLLKVDIVAHSMGGLVTRYFLRYGGQDVLPVLHRDDFRVPDAGAGKVRTAILLGTPNLGSAGSLHGFIEGAAVGLRRIPTEVLATMPAVFQLFPHPINDWLIDIRGQPLDRDLFDVEIWRRFEWSVFGPEALARLRARHDDAHVAALQRLFEANLERARRFVWSLSVKPERDPDVRIVVFGGDCQLTPARLLVEEVRGDSVVRLYPEDIANPLPGIDYGRLMLEPGDRQVTKPSLLAREKLDPTAERHRWLFFPLAYSFFLCEEHQQLTGNVSFQDNLLNVLLSRERPWDAPARAVPAAR
jgi:pimeloyl-ACP methyl ester carboxylesterase